MHTSRSFRVAALTTVANISLVAVLTLTSIAYGQDAPELEDRFASIVLPRGTELNFVVSKRSGTHPTIAILLFAGYPGILHVRQNGETVTYEMRGNFLIRARRHLIGERIFTVMVDCPKDQWSACGDSYRTSDQHAEDIAAVVDKVRSDFGADKVYVMGTSYGTESSSFLARKLGNKLDGAIHTATLTNPRVEGKAPAQGLPMATFDWTSVKINELFVHHKDDPCDLTRYSSIISRKGNAPLITVQGTKGARGAVCEAHSAHGFAGRERSTMQAIADWIITRKTQENVGENEAGD
jgi:hypothetical protein